MDEEEYIRVMILRPGLEKEITTISNSYDGLKGAIGNFYQMAPVYRSLTKISKNSLSSIGSDQE